MGAGASVPSLTTLTIEQIGDLVAECGDDYVVYRSSFVHASIDGQFLHRLDEQNIHQQLSELGIHNEEHAKTLGLRLLQAKNAASGELPDGSVAKSDFELRGVTIALFRSIVKEALERNSDKSYWNMGRISAELIGNHEILKPDCRFGIVDKDATLTFAADSSLIEMLKTAHHTTPHTKLGVTYRQAVGTKANIFVSFAYGDNFIDLVEGLELFVKDEQRDPTTTYFWFDMFVNDQWHALDHDFDWWANTFSTAVESIGETVIFLSPWDKPGMLKRAWCLFEISCSKKVSVAISRAQKDAFVKTLREDRAEIYNALCTIDLEKASSFLPEDMERISAVVRAKDGGFHHFNMMVVGKMRQWVEETARALVMGMGVEEDGVDVVTLEQLIDLGNAASLLQEGGKLDEAMAMNERALRGCEKALGLDHIRTLITINNLGNLLNEQGKYDEAKAMFERALQGYEMTLGPDHINTLTTVNGLAGVLYVQDKLDEAKAMYERALRGREKALGPDHTDTLATVNNLGLLLKDQGKLDEAQAMYERALQGCEKAWGPDHTSTLDTANNLGNLFKEQEKLDEAKFMYERALRGREKALGPDHTSTLGAVNNLAGLLYEQGNVDEAKVMYDRALRGEETVLGPDHPNTLDTVNNIGLLLGKQGKYDEAQAMYDRALRGKERTLGPEHTSTLSTVIGIAEMLKDWEKFDEAQTMYERAVKGREKVLGPDHADTLDTINDLAGLFYAQGKLDEAKAMYERALRGFQKTLGPDHWYTLMVVNNIGEVWLAQGQLDEARAHLQRASQGLTKALGPDHNYTLNATHFLADVLMKEGKYDEALELSDRVKQGREKALGPDHPDTITTAKLLEECSLLAAGLTGAAVA